MADANDLFTSRVVVNPAKHGEILLDQPLEGLECCYDVYYPVPSSSPPPVVILVIGFGDYPRKLESGKGLKDLPPYDSWAKLLAGEGMAVVKASCADPEHALPLLLDHLAANQERLGLDLQRLGLWACSGNGPAAIHLLSQRTDADAAVFLYAYLADLDGHDEVARVAAEFRFCNPAGNAGFVTLNTPLLMVRAGREQFPGLNSTMSRYLAALQKQQGDVEFIDYPDGVHGFDLVDDSAESVRIVKRVLEFLKQQLGLPE